MTNGGWKREIADLSTMKPALLAKLERIRNNPAGREFVLADARDADMAWGVPSPGRAHPVRPKGPRLYSMDEFREQIRAVVRQGVVDIMLGSLSTMSLLAHQERIFARSNVTPAARMNDTTDIWLPRHGKHRETPSRPFASGFIEEAQFGSLTASRKGRPVVNLGLYSVTFNNRTESDLETLNAFKAFRAEAQRKGFHYFLEVFAPNAPAGLSPKQIPDFLNDQVCRMLAGVPPAGRPEFLKIPYFGPRALEELVSYDPSMIVGVLGGACGTTHDAFKLLADARRHGARVALFGRKIKEADHPLTFIAFLRRIVDGEISAKEAVKAYHGELQKLKIPPRRKLAEDLKITDATLNR